jgi:AcrR family transcriptional regulator
VPVSTPITARHEELLDELMAVFLADGFAALTLGELSARLHCSKSTLYALGHSKEAVTVLVLQRFFRRATGRIEDRTARAGTPSDRLIVYLRAVADELRSASPRFMADVAGHPAARAVYEKNTRIAAARVRELITAGSASGDFRGVHTAFVADVVTTTMVRIQNGDVARAVGLKDSEAYDELARLVITGIRR